MEPVPTPRTVPGSMNCNAASAALRFFCDASIGAYYSEIAANCTHERRRNKLRNEKSPPKRALLLAWEEGLFQSDQLATAFFCVKPSF